MKLPLTTIYHAGVDDGRSTTIFHVLAFTAEGGAIGVFEKTGKIRVLNVEHLKVLKGGGAATRKRKGTDT